MKRTTLCIVLAFAASSSALAQSPWSLVPVSGPVGRYAHAMAYDSLRGRTVLFGGLTGGSQRLGDTWEFDGATWTQVSSTGPSPRSHHAMAYDSVRHRTVLCGGTDGVAQSGETWEWDGATWALVSSALPPRIAPAMAFDLTQGKVVLFGGVATPPTGATLLADTWAWDGVSWSLLLPSSSSPSVAGAALAFDVAHQSLILHGVTATAGTYKWTGSGWLLAGALGPSTGVASWFWGGSRMACDAPHGRVVMYDGGSTWAWDGATWRQSVFSSPSPRNGSAMVFDSARGRIVLFGGGGPSAFLAETWEWSADSLASASVYGAGCGAPAPSLIPRMGSLPVPGQSQVSDISNAPFGFAAVAWGVTAQSLSLDFVGATGCTLLNGAEIEVGAFCQSLSLSTAQSSLAIPNDLTLLGVRVYVQAWVLAPGLNALGIAMSNGVELVIGDI